MKTPAVIYYLIATILVLTAAAANAQAPAFGVLFVVNSTGDDGDAAPGNGVCETATGNRICTLRAAIEEVVARNNGGDGININSSAVYLDGALPDITTSVSISGPGATKVIVEGPVIQFRGRVFNVTTSGTVSISGITIAYAFTPKGQNGGAIQNVNAGTVNVTNCILSNNTAGSSSPSDNGSGGAIFNASNGTVNVVNSVFEFNSATAYLEEPSFGGAIYNNAGSVNVTNSTFTGNSSSLRGGGIYNERGVVNITGSTFYGNGALAGGAIASNGGTVTVTNSTFYGNIAYKAENGAIGVGGAIFNEAAGTVNLSNSTVAANFSAQAGSGVYNGSSGGIVNVKNTIIALNYGGIKTNSPDVFGPFRSRGFNLIGKKDGSTGFTMGTDKKGTIASPLDPKLDPKGLRNNGGPTQTVALIASSPAIDKGTSSSLTGTLTTDQRGFARTVDNISIPNANGGDGTDIGAFEFGAQ